jgi:hypothetical protein
MIAIRVRWAFIRILKTVSVLVESFPSVLSLLKTRPPVVTRRLVEKRTLDERIPVGSWDSHMHVVSSLIQKGKGYNVSSRLLILQ